MFQIPEDIADDVPVCATKPMREPETNRWEVGDLVQIDGARYVIRAISGNRHQVQLEQTNCENHALRWTTELSNLPKKGSKR